MSAASPPCESTMVVMHEFSGSGGNRTRVMMPGTTSEKCLETNVEISDDFPTPSIFIINCKKKEKKKERKKERKAKEERKNKQKLAGKKDCR